MSDLIPVSTINIEHETYTNCQNITSVNLDNIVWVNYSMSDAFANCSNLTSVVNINTSVINMYNTFYNCQKLNVTPTVPDNVTNLAYTFYNCVNIPTTPTMPNNVTDLSYTFYNCNKITTSPTIPNSVVTLDHSFSGCNNIVTAPSIPNSITNMYGTFENCTNLTGQIYIHTTDVTNATNCFNSTSLTKNVYIPFYEVYTNKVNTTTRSSFVSAGYTETGTPNGVYLKNLTPVLTVNTNPADATVSLSADDNSITANSIAVPLNANVSWYVSKSGYQSKVGQVNNLVSDQTISVTLTAAEVPDWEFIVDNNDLATLTKYNSDNIYVIVPDTIQGIPDFNDAGNVTDTSIISTLDAGSITDTTIDVNGDAGSIS